MPARDFSRPPLLPLWRVKYFFTGLSCAERAARKRHNRTPAPHRPPALSTLRGPDDTVPTCTGRSGGASSPSPACGASSPSPACGGGLGRGPPDAPPSFAPPAQARGRSGVRADVVSRTGDAPERWTLARDTGLGRRTRCSRRGSRRRAMNCRRRGWYEGCGGAKGGCLGCRGAMAAAGGWAWAKLSEITAPVSNIDPRKLEQQEFTYIDLSAIDAGHIRKAEILTTKDAPSQAKQLVKGRRHSVFLRQSLSQKYRICYDLV